MPRRMLATIVMLALVASFASARRHVKYHAPLDEFSSFGGGEEFLEGAALPAVQGDMFAQLSGTLDMAESAFLQHSTAPRISTDSVILDTLRKQYPHLPITIVPFYGNNLFSYAAAGFAEASLVIEANGTDSLPIFSRNYIPPARRVNGGRGKLLDQMEFGKYTYTWQGEEFIVYLVDGRDGPNIRRPVQFVLGGPQHVVDELLMVSGKYQSELHEAIWVFDQGYWQQDRLLYRSIAKARWENVILKPEKKKAIQDDAMRFFNNSKRYEELNVPWKRGVIYYGPPGNGKTISIKALMNQLANLEEPIPTLYVRSLRNMYGGPEQSIKMIFSLARREAPCLLVFEDLDSLISDSIRSYFLNEVDGLTSNDGIFMVGSTNHLDRLDPGVANRPSRFDRKFEFSKPDFGERVQYAEFWRGKLEGNKEGVEFPPKLSERIAEITDDFSFAFMQEAFVASLLAIAAVDEAEVGVMGAAGFTYGDVEQWTDKDELDGLMLWREMKKQVELLRKDL